MPAYYGRCAFRATHQTTGLLVVNVFHLEVAVLTDPPNWSDIARDVHTWLGQAWRNILADSFTFQEVTVTDENYPGSTHGQGVAVDGLPGTRTAANSSLDGAMCGLISFKTAVAKRYGRGHLFMAPAWDSTQATNGHVWNTGGTYYSTMTAFKDSLMAGHTAGSTDYAPIIFSRTLEKRGETPFVFPITGATVNLTQHWLRSRSKAP